VEAPIHLGDAFDFEGKAVLVTGGTRGVGRGIAEAFLQAGADVAVCGRHEPPRDRLPAACGGHREPRRAVFLEADLRVPEEAEGVVTRASEVLGGLDVLVNNAGGSPYRLAADSSPRFASAVVELNLLAPFWCSRAANVVMQGQSAGGAIISIGSVSGTRPSPGTALYGAAKAGLASLTQSLAVEWAPKVRVNCIVAGLLATEAALDHYGGRAGIDAVERTVPAGRLGTPSDVAAACVFLASPLARWITGTCMLLHGGGETPAFLTALGEARRDRGPDAIS